MDQSAGIRVFQQPQRTVGRLFHIANTFADIPALGRLGSTFTVEDDAIQRLRRQAADEAVAVPLRDRKSTRLNSSHRSLSRMPSSA